VKKFRMRTGEQEGARNGLKKVESCQNFGVKEAIVTPSVFKSTQNVKNDIPKIPNRFPLNKLQRKTSQRKFEIDKNLEDNKKTNEKLVLPNFYSI